jgi:hypothetical protein
LKTIMANAHFRSCMLSPLFALVLGCMQGALDQPTSTEPALTLQVRLAAALPKDVTEVGLGLEPIFYCPVMDQEDGPARRAFELEPETVRTPRDRLGGPTRLPVAGSGWPEAFGCEGQRAPFVRFFRPLLWAVPFPAGSRPWAARDVLVAYAAEPVTFTLFAPDDAPIALPAGYSLLRRICGSPAQPWRLEVISPDETIDIHPPLNPWYAQPFPGAVAVLDGDERALLAQCGITPPALDLGKRMGFDRTQSLAFSPDQQQVLYIVPADFQEPAHPSPLRSLSQNGSVRELAIVRNGTALKITSAGDIYFFSDTTLTRAELQPDGNVTVRAFPPDAGYNRVSPDGRWMLGDDRMAVHSPGEPITTKLREVATGVERDLGQVSASWSPQSQLVEHTGESPNATFDVVAPDDGHLVARFPAPDFSPLAELYWGPDAPVQVAIATDWEPQRRLRPQIIRLRSSQDWFGLLVEDVRGGGPREVLKTSAGRLHVAAEGPGTLLVWARKCLGLFETVCTFELHRVTLPAGDDQVVAVADSAAPVALSPSGRRIAIGARDGIYVRDLP